MKGDLVLRPVYPSDRLGVLHVESGLDSPWDWQDHREFLADRGHVTAVAVRGGHVLGFACLGVTPTLVRVERLAVAGDVRRERVGSYLLWYAAKTFVTADRPAVEAWVGEYHLAGQLFLRANGFKWVHTREWDGIGEYTMRKDYRDD